MPLSELFLPDSILALNGLAYADSVDYTPPVTSPESSRLIPDWNRRHAGFPGFIQVSRRRHRDSGRVDITPGLRARSMPLPSITSGASTPPMGQSASVQYGQDSSHLYRRRSPYSVGLIDATATNHQLYGGAPAPWLMFISAAHLPRAQTHPWALHLAGPGWAGTRPPPDPNTRDFQQHAKRLIST